MQRTQRALRPQEKTCYLNIFSKTGFAVVTDTDGTDTHLAIGRSDTEAFHAAMKAVCGGARLVMTCDVQR